MRKTALLLLILFFCSSSVALSQQREIRKDLSKKNIALRARLKNKESERKIRIDRFLQERPSVQKQWTNAQGTVFELHDIRNGRPIFRSTMNVHAATATKTRPLQTGGTSGLNLNGAGLTIGVWDGGPVEDTHNEFTDTATPENPVSRVEIVDDTTVSGEQEFDDHATHVAGTIAAQGADPNARGMAPNARIKSYNWTGDEIEVLAEVTAAEDAIILSNHSYGVPIDQGENNLLPAFIMGSYEHEARDWDEILYLNPGYLMVKSAGNDGNTSYEGALLAGFDKLTTNAVSKNNLVIANANPQLVPFVGEISSLTINNSSSKGPTDDLRIKPDIAADGTQLYSSVSGNSYGTASGTSMSAPNTTGTLALLQQYHHQQQGQYMLAATLKGLVIHTAVDDDQNANPDPIFGWGFLNASDAASVIGNSVGETTASIEEHILNEGEVYRVHFSAAANSKVVATLSWTDPPGAISQSVVDEIPNNSAPALVNDLDVKITSSSGTDYFPWRLEFPNQQAFVATRGINNVDNVERIDFVSPNNDSYTLTVSHKGKLLNDVDADPSFDYSQNFSLILSGDDVTLGFQSDNLSKHFHLSPNPAIDEVSLQIDIPIELHAVKIFGLDGRLHKTWNVKRKESSHTISVKGLSSGLFLMQINTSEGAVVKKLLVLD